MTLAKNWQHTLKTITVAYRMFPTTLDQLLSIVDAAEAAGKHVRAVGSAWAFSDVAATADFLAETHGLNAALATAAVAGYLSLRFTGPAQAILGMQQAALNCSIEVSLIRGVLYNDKVMRAIETYTLDNGGRLHWGQRNDLLTAMQLNETMYPRITSWRNVRSKLTRQGTLHTFDNSFTARCGL